MKYYYLLSSLADQCNAHSGPREGLTVRGRDRNVSVHQTWFNEKLSAPGVYMVKVYSETRFIGSVSEGSNPDLHRPCLTLHTLPSTG